MDLKKFMLFDAIGDIAWSITIIFFGYFLGSRIPGIEHIIEPLLILIVLAFLGPTLYHVLKDPKIRVALRQKFTSKKQR